MADNEWKESGGRKPPRKAKSQDEMIEENGIEEEPDFSDPEDYVDDISDEGLCRIFACKVQHVFRHVFQMFAHLVCS